MTGQPQEDTPTASVVVADDEPLMRELVKALLDAEGFDVIEAEDGQAAIDACRDLGDDLDLLIADVSMPGITGPDAVEEIRNTRPTLPVLFLSGHDPDSAGGLPEPDASTDVVRKPFESDQLIQAVTRLLRGS
jgi:CheY-like chemotaxis protein